MRITTIFGIYGFQITKPVEVVGLKITPISTEHTKAKLLARDESKYNLTAIVEGGSLSNEDVFLIEGILSFIERLDVKLARPFDGSNSVEALAPVLLIQKRLSGGGSVIGEDTFFPDSRKEFIERCFTKLKDRSFCAESKLNSLFFKIIETFRLRSPFIEMQFFLLFSGLESHARAIQDESDKRSAAELIYKKLKNYGFDVTQEISKTPARAIETYAQIRNSIFHRNELSAIVKNSSGEDVPLDAFQSYFSLSMLASLTVMKAVGFDDGHINWNAWIDRQPFK